nr:MAG TPA: hypothetical protein [Caudoviricetes sp.]
MSNLHNINKNSYKKIPPERLIHLLRWDFFIFVGFLRLLR